MRQSVKLTGIIKSHRGASALKGLKSYSIKRTHRSGLLVDSYPNRWDIENSHDSYLVDKETQHKYLDMHCGFGSLPLSWNHPKLTHKMKKQFDTLPSHYVNKPSNSDFYTDPYFEFIDTFKEKVVPSTHKYQFFGGDGAWAVTQMIKVATDWKLRFNPQLGSTKIMYFEKAFHGRDGFTLSMTNTDPIKTMNFPKFNEWIRIDNLPIVNNRYNLHDYELVERENQCIDRIGGYLRLNDDVAALVVEPIQCEGGDRYFSKRFLQALQSLCDQYDVLFCVDEVQTGFFTTGSPWYFQKLGLVPDLVSFSKKTQQGGIFASGNKLDRVSDHCFKLSSRINSTWGGNLVDMIRCKHIIDIIHEDNLMMNAHLMGRHWYYAMKQLENVEREKYVNPVIKNVRNAGLIMAFDMNSSKARDVMLDQLLDNRVLALGCGETTVRFRPNLSVKPSEIDELVEKTQRVIENMRQPLTT